MPEKNIKILIATHKKYQMPKDDMYLPIHVGREGKTDLGYPGDNTGDNISSKNNSWCELTGLYWGWKNLDCDYLGLVQYRRHFMYKKKGKKFDSILNQKEAEKLLEDVDIVLPLKRNYRIDTLEEHFNGYDFSVDTDIPNLKRIIHEQSPEYDEAFNTVMNWKSGHMCNMFLMKKELLNDFCEWEFKILNEFEKTVAPERQRIVGYAAEHMLDVWIEKNHYPYVECKVALLDRKNEIERRIDFVMRKLGIDIRLITLVPKYRVSGRCLSYQDYQIKKISGGEIQKMENDFSTDHNKNESEQEVEDVKSKKRSSDGLGGVTNNRLNYANHCGMAVAA
ncbi:MAG: DUF4422 domain-containing protein [Clostridiales bacterium]|nr:DUF4422 domain-containing protein [Clostridiales bacterium]